MPAKKAKKKATKKKAPKNQKAQVEKAIVECLDDMAFIGVELSELLPKFKRLKVEDRRRLYDQLNKLSEAFCGMVDDYEDAAYKPAGEEKKYDIGLSIAGALGIAFGIAAFAGGGPDKPESKDPEWPDAIDIEGRRIDPQPKLLNPGEEKS